MLEELALIQLQELVLEQVLEQVLVLGTVLVPEQELRLGQQLERLMGQLMALRMEQLLVLVYVEWVLGPMAWFEGFEIRETRSNP